MFEEGTLVVFGGAVYRVMRVYGNGQYSIRSDILRLNAQVDGTALSRANDAQWRNYEALVAMLYRPCAYGGRVYMVRSFVGPNEVRLRPIPTGRLINAVLSNVNFELTEEQREIVDQYFAGQRLVPERKPARPPVLKVNGRTIFSRSWAVFRNADGLIPVSDEEQALLQSLNVRLPDGRIDVNVVAFCAYCDWWADKSTLIGLYLRHMLSLAQR